MLPCIKHSNVLDNLELFALFMLKTEILLRSTNKNYFRKELLDLKGITFQDLNQFKPKLSIE